ncbi:hypothetical protein OK344_08880 [Kaistella sp. BT6-1-3]|uniref:Curlin associated repeat-containing protein n=1 Tax=Kaistella yananensis TaxID=2989820 RepID=A0ABT3JNH0_9FLAO|nr:hypothetical protein [Kaistella yananensis]MCW4452322.1 hypothetical protein [Kaistella yananensis]
MNTLAKILSVNLLMCILVVTGQQFSFENINSKNAMAIVAQIQDNSISTKNYEVTTVQYGTQNFAEIYANSTTNLSALQLGDYNYLNFNNVFEKTRASAVITTQGNNNIIDVVGSNSISEKMQLHVKGDNMTIYMRNY